VGPGDSRGALSQIKAHQISTRWIISALMRQCFAIRVLQYSNPFWNARMSVTNDETGVGHWPQNWSPCQSLDQSEKKESLHSSAPIGCSSTNPGSKFGTDWPSISSGGSTVSGRGGGRVNHNPRTNPALTACD